MTNIILSMKDKELFGDALDNMGYCVGGRKPFVILDKFPFPDDDVARIIMPVIFIHNDYNDYKQRREGTVIVSIMPDMNSGAIHAYLEKRCFKSIWKKNDDGTLSSFPYNNDYKWDDAQEAHSTSHAYLAILALFAVSQNHQTKIEVSKKTMRGMVGKAATQLPQGKNDKYYILDLSKQKSTASNDNNEHSGIRMRYHMCRGHYRHYKNGKVSFVKGHYRGDKSLGIVHKDYSL